MLNSILFLIIFIVILGGCALPFLENSLKKNEGMDITADFGKHQNKLEGNDTTIKTNNGVNVSGTNVKLTKPNHVTIQYKVIDLALRERIILWFLIFIFMNLKPPRMIIYELWQSYKKKKQ